jgi:hypothetical protein
MGDDIDAIHEGYGWRKVATGTWFYDKIVPKPIAVWAKPARFAASRFDEDDQLIETRAIPETKDGFLYFFFPGRSGEYFTVEEAKAAADAAPWGPVQWD